MFVMMYLHHETNVQQVLAMDQELTTVSKVNQSNIIGGSPSPDTYNAIESFNKIFAIRGFKMKLPLNDKKVKNQVPGPGSYFVNNILSVAAKVPTLKGRFKSHCTVLVECSFCY